MNIYYHGTNGDNILSILSTGALRPNAEGRIYLARYGWEACFMYGADRRRGASFVVQLAIDEASVSARHVTETPGVRDTLVLHTDGPLAAKVLELYVRRLSRDDGPIIDRFLGEEAIRRYLGG